MLVSRDGGITWVLQRHGVREQDIINEERLGRAKEHLAELQEQLDAFEGDDEARAELETALEIARDIAVNCAPLPVAMHKRLLWRGQDTSLAELAALESRALNYTMTRPDAVEGGLAYFERRSPNWTGSIANDWPDWLN